MKEQKRVLEAALFMSDRPLNLNDLSKIVGVNSLGFVKDMIEKLQEEYRDKGVNITSTPEGWKMDVNQDVLPKVSHLTPYSDIPEGCKRTLALIVYKEPVKQSEVIKMQGNKAYAYIKFLERKGLVKTQLKGHTKILHLTSEFERYFGESKEAIKERMEVQDV